MKDIDKIHNIVRHIKHVQESCFLLGERLIGQGEFELGKNLIANGLVHDYSKFFGIEWDHMFTGNPDTTSLKLAVSQHNRTNKHHPEYWGGIHKVPRIYLAELVCDWKARSNEFGSSLVEWIESEAMKRFGFTKADAVYKEIMEFVDLLCDKPFKPVKE